MLIKKLVNFCVNIRAPVNVGLRRSATGGSTQLELARYAGCIYQKDRNPGFTRKYGIFENVLEESFRIWKGALGVISI